MVEKLKLKLASVLFSYAFPIYRQLYFRFKSKKDRFNLELIRKLIKPGSNVMDIGANIGFYTKFLSVCAGEKGQVFSFEPDQTNFRHLQNETAGIANITLVQKAVASASGKLTLYTSSLLNVDHRTYQPEEYKDKYFVDKISIDDFVAGRFEVNFIKMDIQGFEMDALKGMEKTLETNRDIILFTELWPYGLQLAGSSAVEVFDFFSNKKFHVYTVNNGIPEQMNREDALAIKVDFFSDANILATRSQLKNTP